MIDRFSPPSGDDKTPSSATEPEPYTQRRSAHPPPNPRHMVIAGSLLAGAALFIVALILTGVVPETERVISGAVIAGVFAFVGCLFLHRGLIRMRWRKDRGIPLDWTP